MNVGRVQTGRDLEDILQLQRECLAPTADGFVTVQHSLDILKAMHALAPSIIARGPGGDLAGYALVMPRETRQLLPILEPLFVKLEALALPPRWYVMGQIAVAPKHRGAGVFDALYQGHREHYARDFDTVVTEISTRNGRSLRAHHRVGFETLTTYRDETDDWAVVAWRWGGPRMI